MITIIIALSRSRDPLDNLQSPQVGLSDYLLIRLITVFDPAFCRVFFWLFRLMKIVDGRDHSKNVSGHERSLQIFAESALENQSR
jgi:hypothetical protein